MTKPKQHKEFLVMASCQVRRLLFRPPPFGRSRLCHVALVLKKSFGQS
ncbi:hypothetical protein H6F96_13585 [Microcoleus sp. FACHB-53]|nr:hypothetical protein [Microcoleus sp. FACHB-53]MBD2125168.1 hypothetical protein [Microcoleus sp. FACHB-1]